MVVWVILFFSLLWFKTNQTSVREQKRPCTAYQDTPEIHPSVHPKVGGVDLRAGCRARRVAVAAEVGKVVSGRAGVGKGRPCCACCGWRDLLLSVWEETIVTRERKRKKADQRTEGTHLLLYAPGFQQEIHPRTSGIHPTGGSPYMGTPSVKHIPPLTLLPPLFFLC